MKMKAVMMSIQPKWCELIASGEKTIEVRKTKPKFETPFKVYIYETKAVDKSRVVIYVDSTDPCKYYKGSGKVIGEFVCDEITEFYPTMDLKQLTSIHFQMCEKSCVDMENLYNYANDKSLYGYHISELVIYDEPKELSEFWKGDKCPYASEKGCTYKYHCFRSGQVKRCGETLIRPPQSWCYVEKLV